jgi:hypothetical protein
MDDKMIDCQAVWIVAFTGESLLRNDYARYYRGK